MVINIQCYKTTTLWIILILQAMVYQDSCVKNINQHLNIEKRASALLDSAW